MPQFPVYKQLDSMDCGPTCLRMVARYYGKSYSLQFLRSRSYITKSGVSILGISQAEYERSRQGYIQKQAAFAGYESSLKNTEAGIVRLRETLVDLKISHEREIRPA